jgi:hypothetical protein
MVVDGRPAVAYDAGYLCYRRASDANGDTWTSGTHYLDGGGYAPCLTSVDGKPAMSYWETGPLDPPDEGKDLMLLRAADADGAGWNAPQTIDSSHTMCGYTNAICTVGGQPFIAYSIDWIDGAWFPPLAVVQATDDAGTAWGASVSPGGQGSFVTFQVKSALELAGGEAAVCGNAGGAYYFVYY